MPNQEHDNRSRRRPDYDDNEPRSREGRSDRRKDSDHHRHHDRHRSRDRRDRRRSYTPDSSSRRPRSRDQKRDPSRDRDRDHQRDRERTRRRSREDRKPYRRDDRDPKDDVKKSSSALKRDGPLPSQDNAFAVTTGQEPEKPKEKPNFGNSGLLAAASNSVLQGDGTAITLKYHEPAEARKPSSKDQWKLFVFKGGDIADTIDLSARSFWLVGKDVAVVDLPAEHPSISRQHAVIQFRYTEKRNEFGDKIGKVKPYIIDLESANGTVLNHEKIPDSRYLELRHKDMVQFGHSTREYVVMLAPRK